MGSAPTDFFVRTARSAFFERHMQQTARDVERAQNLTEDKIQKAAADATPRRPSCLRRAAPQTSAGISVGRIKTAAISGGRFDSATAQPSQDHRVEEKQSLSMIWSENRLPLFAIML